MSRYLSGMWMLACALVALSACQVVSGANKLSVSDAEDSQSMSGSVSSQGSGGASATVNAGRGSAALPESRIGGVAGARATQVNTAPAVDTGNHGLGANDSAAAVGGMGGGASMPMHTGLADPQMAMGTPTTTISQSPPVAMQAGAEAVSPPVAGSGALPADPSCEPPLPGASCDTAPQCGCHDGENCAYVSLDAPSCVRAGTVGLHQNCEMTADCQLGLQCFAGACLKLCDPNGPGCENGAACTQPFSGSQAITGLYTCSSDCNLSAPQLQRGALAACGLGLTCVWSGGGSECAHPRSTVGRHGEICADSRDCAPGYTCMDSGSCARWCETAQDCPSGFRCEDTATEVAGVRFGLCRPNCNDQREITCETSPQCGCETGMTCSHLRRTDSLVIRGCRAVGPTPAYEECENKGECGADTACVGDRCSPYCERSDECGAYGECIQVTNRLVSNDPPIPDFTVCRRPCDPADLHRAHGLYEACPRGTGCEPVDDGRSYCHSVTENAERYAPCSEHTDCALGYSCTDDGCEPQCRTDNDCPSDNECVPFDPRDFAGDIEWGTCRARSR